VPEEYPARLEYTRELANDAHVLGRVREEAERSKEIEHCIESSAPARRHLPHVATRVSQSRASATLPGDREQIARVVETIHIVSSFGK
jgi:hypothetical protein